ncbi:hypothetical protein HaLaN_31492 [Haematococcus lacustris]|uniref:Uncharacterized protein n=1 Tax=Haematococcus lacustris TaxID=44745 RepID=A0A6A0AIE4_HAELA|nr:hypothetical protein HaLaN_31492 [Haematococcus lacustris]
MWCPIVPPCKPPRAPCSSQAATPAAASEPGPSTPPLTKRSKCTEAEQAAEPTQPCQPTNGQAAKAKPAPQPGSAENAAYWGEQVAAAGAVLLARPGSTASQGQGVIWPGLQVAARRATQGPAAGAAAAC